MSRRRGRCTTAAPPGCGGSARCAGIETTFFDATEPGALEAALQPGRTRLVWIESPTNPTWDVIDIAAAAEAAHAAGARLAVDCTVAPPCTMRALELGADFAFHSGTKYLGGHSDLTAGVLSAARRDATLGRAADRCAR